MGAPVPEDREPAPKNLPEAVRASPPREKSTPEKRIFGAAIDVIKSAGTRQGSSREPSKEVDRR